MKKFNQKYKLSDIIQNGFIFTKMVNLDNELNFVNSENMAQLDIHYFIAHAQDKVMSSTVSQILDEETAGTISDALELVASILLTEYGDKWSKLYATLTAEYDALNDINYSETETPDITESTNIDTNSENNGDSVGNLYGFNSDTEIPANTAYNTVNTHNTADADSNYKTRTGTITRDRVGNMGDKSSLLKKEVDARKNMIYNIIYADIDDVMTLPVWL